VLSGGKTLEHPGSTDAGLTRTLGVDCLQHATSVLSFVRKFKEEGTPTGILHGLGQPPASQAFDVQLLYGNDSVVLHQPKRKLVLKFVALASDSLIHLLQLRDCFPPTMAAFPTSCHSSLGPTQFGFRLTLPAGIGNRLTVRQCRKGCQSDIHPNLRIQPRQRFWFAFYGKANVPLVAFPLHRDGLNRASHRTVQFDFNLSDTLNTQRVAGQLDPIPVAGKRNAVVSTPRLESRVARFFSSLYPAEESLEGLVHPTKNILAAGEISQTQVTGGTNVFQLVRLVVVVNRNPLFPGISTLLQRRIVESARLPQLLRQSLRLETRCEEPISKRLAHGSFGLRCIA